MSSNNGLQIVVASLALLALTAAESAAAQPSGETGWDWPSKGPRHALVTIYEFSDFECSHCSGVRQTLDALRYHYGDKLRVAFKQ